MTSHQPKPGDRFLTPQDAPSLAELMSDDYLAEQLLTDGLSARHLAALMSCANYTGEYTTQPNNRADLPQPVL